MASVRPVLEAPEVSRALTRIAHELLERNKGPQDLVLLGIPRRGVPLARRLAERLAAVEPGVDAAAITGALDVTMHRDDLRALAVIYDLPPSELAEQLISWGVLDPDARRAVQTNG